MNRRYFKGVLLFWFAFGPATLLAGQPLLRTGQVHSPGTARERSIYGRWVASHFVAPRGGSLASADPASAASLVIAQLEVSKDTAAGRYDQLEPVVTRTSSGRQWLFWIDEKHGTGRVLARFFDAGLSPLTTEFDLFGDLVERDPKELSCTGNGTIAVLSWLNGEPYGIRSAFVDSLGTVQFEHTANESVSPPFLSGPAGARLADSGFLTVWEEFRSGWRIMGQPFDSAGTRLGVNRPLDGSDDTLLKMSPAVAGDTSGGYLVAWAQGGLSRSDIYVRRFDASHDSPGGALAITSPLGSESYLLPRVTYNASDDRFHVVYIQTDLPADSTVLWVRSISSDGLILDSALPVPAGPYPWRPQAAQSGGLTVILTERYDNLSEIRSLALDGNGTVVDSSEVVSTAVTRERSGVSSTTGADTLTVVWQDRVSGEYDLHGRLRYGGQDVSAETALQSEGPGGQQTDPSVTGRLGGGVHLAYTDMQAGSDIALADIDEGGAILLRRSVSDDSLQAAQYDPHAASSSSGWCFITWTDERTDWPGPAVHAAGRFAQAGIFVSPAFPLSASTAAVYQGQTDVTMRSDKSSAAVWVDDRSGSALAYLRRFDGTGAPQGAEVALDDGSQSQLLIAFEQDPVVSMDSGGTLWTVWTAFDVITESFHVLAQAWSSTGVRKGTNVVLSPAGSAESPLELDAAALGDGRLRLVWFDAFSASPSVKTAVFDSLGAILEGPATVSGAPISAHGPCLAVDATGRWSVGWSQQTGSSEDLVWQRFDADGTPSASLEQISGVTPATRRRGCALAFAGSYLYGAWYDNELSGKGYDVRLSSQLKATSDIGVEGALRPDGFALFANYPNPFNGSTRISFSLAQPSEVELVIFDVLGRNVRSLTQGRQGPGLHHLLWDGRDEQGRALASGVYFYRLQAGPFADTRKLLYLK